MKLLNEIYRIKNIMSLHEATNPILNFITGPFVKKAWSSMVSSYGNNTQGLKTALGNIARNDLDDIFIRLNPGLPVPTDIDQLVDDVVSTIDSLTPEEVTSVIKALSKSEPYKRSLTSTLMDSKPFNDTMSKAFSSGEIKPQEIKNILTDEFGEEIATKLYDNLRIKFDPSKVMKKELSTFMLPSSSVEELINTVEDPTLKTAIKGYLTPNRLNELFSKAQKASLEGTVIDSNYFKNEFLNIVKNNPNFWTELRRLEFQKLMQRLLAILNKGGKKGANFSKQRIYLASLIGLGVAAYWANSVYEEGKKETLESFLQKCMIKKGYNDQEAINNAKINKPQEVNIDFTDCLNEAKSLSMGKGIEKLKSTIPSFEDKKSDISVDNVFGPSVVTTPTQTQTQYEMSVSDFLIWADKAKVKLSDKERLTVKIEDDPLYGEKVIKVTTDFGPRKTYVLKTDKSGFSF